MKQPATLKVLPNPFFALDARGMPMGAVRWDPSVGRPNEIHHVGVVVTREVVSDAELKGNRERLPRERRRRVSYAWSQKPVSIPPSTEHVSAVRAGLLFPADKESARACKVWFEDPAKAIAAARLKAIAEWRSCHDEDPPVEKWDAAIGPRANEVS